MGNDSDFLFPTPSLLSGIARTMDLWGHLDIYNLSATAAEADARAIFADWHAVADDLLEAANGFQNPSSDSAQLALFEPAISR